ncbi:MAG: ABC transporter substrate-binding protein [Bacteroidales bacterium]|nr:ABC transporter substrate-binding protein [Bacteroidales bacterium]
MFQKLNIKFFLLKNIFIFLSFLFLLSCGDRRKDENKLSVFKYNEASGITSLDPAFAKDQSNIWACNQLFNGLIQLNDKLEVEPCIAKYWEISDDGLCYTFYLRNDVYFHDNQVFKHRKVTAYDFEYCFNRIVDTKLVSPGAWVFNNVEQKNSTYSFKALNDTVFTIKLYQAFPPFLSILSMQYCSVVPKEAIEYYGKDFRKFPIGTGPFQFKMWKEGVKLVFVKNHNYFEKFKGESLPYLDAVAITFLIDKQSAFLEFVKGKLDFMSGIDASYKDELLTKRGQLNPKYQNKFKLITQPYLNTEYLGILVDINLPLVRKNPLRLKTVRQAINYGFDRKKMMKYLRNNIGTPGNYGIIPLGLPSFDSSRMQGYDYNPDLARKLLSDAGFPNGEGLPPITLSTTADYLDLCKYIQHQLSEIGIKIKIDVNPPAALKELKAQAKLNFFRASWIADYPDAENYLSLFYSKNFCPAGPNYTHFSNYEFDKLYELSQFEENDSLRYVLYRKMDNMIMREAPVIILYYDQVLRFVQNNIDGLTGNPINLLILKKVKKIDGN